MPFTIRTQRRHLSACWFALAVVSLAAHAADPVRWNLVSECQMIVLPQKNALELIPLLNDAAKIEAANLQLQELIKSGGAELAADLVVQTLDGAKGFSESAEELRYPTEFDPPRLPADLPKEQPLEVLKAWPAVSVTPTAFETRNVGAALELTASILGDGRWIDVTANPRHVRFRRWEKFEAGVLPTGTTIGVEQPIFLSFTNQNSVLVRNGQLILLGVHKLPDAPASFELFLLRVTAKKAE